MIYTDPTSAAADIAAVIEQAHTILILSHVNPDGDAISSMLAMWHMLRNNDKKPIALASSQLPSYTQVLPGIEDVQVYDHGMALPESDLIVMVDVANLERVGMVYEDHATLLATRPLLIIDHHVTNIGQGTVNLIVPAAASCADLVYRLLCALDEPITPEIATCLLMGINTDTQSFQTSSTKADTLRAAAGLLDAGGNLPSIVNALYRSLPYSTVLLIGLSLSTMQHDGDIIWTFITRNMMEQSGAEDSAYDDVVMMMQRIAHVRVSVLFKERLGNETKLSLRSVPGIDVAALARTWQGGGHTQAAGATLHMSLEDAQREVLPAIRAVLASSVK